MFALLNRPLKGSRSDSAITSQQRKVSYYQGTREFKRHSGGDNERWWCFISLQQQANSNFLITGFWGNSSERLIFDKELI